MNSFNNNKAKSDFDISSHKLSSLNSNNYGNYTDPSTKTYTLPPKNI